MQPVRDFFESMTGRVFVLLTLGMVAAGSIATILTVAKSDREFSQQLLESAADRVQCYVDVVDTTPVWARKAVLETGGGGIWPQSETVHGKGEDAEFQDVLEKRGGLVANAEVQAASLDTCFPKSYTTSPTKPQQMWETQKVQNTTRQMSQAGMGMAHQNATTIIPPVCRLITLRLNDGTKVRFSLGTPWVERERSRFLDPAFITFLLIAVAILAYVVARIASAPLNRLAAAAAELGQHLDRAPVPVSGPTEVRDAAEAFNAMQLRLQQHVTERTQMLAAITHDLQTPLTRLRLRLERVDDEALRERLVADLAAMRALIDEGLELARSAETSEPRVMLDLDSLLESLVEDAVGAGSEARFEHGCQAVLHVRPLAVRRLLSNLIDNAIKYGGCALVSAAREGDQVRVHIRDRGPGLPEDMLERVFDPFVRLEASRSRQSGGAGLGLTIAFALAEKNGATLSLRNHPEGGLEAIICWEVTQSATQHG